MIQKLSCFALNMNNLLIKFIVIIYCVTVAVGVTIEPLEEDEKVAIRYVMLVKGYRVLYSVVLVKR